MGERYELDRLIGGFTDGSPWERCVGLALPDNKDGAYVASPLASAGSFSDGAQVPILVGSGLASR